MTRFCFWFSNRWPTFLLLLKYWVPKFGEIYLPLSRQGLPLKIRRQMWRLMRFAVWSNLWLHRPPKWAGRAPSNPTKTRKCGDPCLDDFVFLGGGGYYGYSSENKLIDIIGESCGSRDQAANSSNTTTPRLTTSESSTRLLVGYMSCTNYKTKEPTSRVYFLILVRKFHVLQNKPINISHVPISFWRGGLLETGHLDLSLLLQTTLRTCAGSPTRGMGHGAGATFFETSETTQREKAEGTTDVTFGQDVGNELFEVWLICVTIFVTEKSKIYAGVVFNFPHFISKIEWETPKRVGYYQIGHYQILLNVTYTYILWWFIPQHFWGMIMNVWWV